MKRDPEIQAYVNYFFREASDSELAQMKTFMLSRDTTGPRWYAFHVNWNLGEIEAEMQRRSA